MWGFDLASLINHNLYIHQRVADAVVFSESSLYVICTRFPDLLFENAPDVAVLFLCDRPQQQLRVGTRLGWCVAFVFAAAGVADVELGALKREDLVGAA